VECNSGAPSYGTAKPGRDFDLKSPRHALLADHFIGSQFPAGPLSGQMVGAKPREWLNFCVERFLEVLSYYH
jgi:hypothetical protein